MHADCASHNGALFLSPLVCHMLCFQEYNITLPPSNTLRLISTPLDQNPERNPDYVIQILAITQRTNIVAI